MSAVDAGLVFLPRLTSLVGEASFTTAPLDVSRQGGAQFQVWRGPIRVSSGSGSLLVYLEESFDAQTWSLGATTVTNGLTILENVPHFFSYSFRLRWFRLRFSLSGTNPMVSCWAEGLLRGGGEGMWGFGPAAVPSGLPHGALAEGAPRPVTPWWMSDPHALELTNNPLGMNYSGTPLDPRRFHTRESWERELERASRNMWSPLGYIPSGSWNMMPWMPGLAGGGGGFGPLAPSAAPPVAPPPGKGP